MELEKELEQLGNNLNTIEPSTKYKFDQKIQLMLDNKIIFPLLHLDSMDYQFLPEHKNHLYSLLIPFIYENKDDFWLYLSSHNISLSKSFIDVLFSFNDSQYFNLFNSFNFSSSLFKINPHMIIFQKSKKYEFIFNQFQSHSDYIFTQSSKKLQDLVQLSETVNKSFWSKTPFKNFYLSKKFNNFNFINIYFLELLSSNIVLSNQQALSINQSLSSIIQNLQPFKNTSFFNSNLQPILEKQKKTYEKILQESINSSDSVFSSLLDYTNSIQQFFQNKNFIKKSIEPINPLYTQYFNIVNNYREIKHTLSSDSPIHLIVEEKLLSAFQEYKKIENSSISKNNKNPSEIFSEVLSNVQSIIDNELHNINSSSINHLHKTNNHINFYKNNK